MITTRDYASTRFMDCWLRHPVLGDPSFDTFERVGETVHRSQPPYEWAVNGSLFRDFDDTWYYYAGLYPYGYGGSNPSRFKIYRSSDRGASWDDLGWGFENGFVFDNNTVASDGCPDVALCYDDRHGKYLLTYDTSTNDFTWETAHDPYSKVEAGAALAWADSPAGPFERIPRRFVTDRFGAGCCGKFDRYYASTVFPRKNDYIAFILTDSGRYYSWGYAVMTAPTPEGPWSKPHMVLSNDRPEYYPCPVEFHPAEVHDGIVYCSATSVAMNRNYQAVFQADLEQAHDPNAWRLTANGNAWHARDHEDEYYGIWGQTWHGFIEPDTGRYVVMFPSKDARDYGTLSVAARPWDTPHSDGFTMTGHGGPSISPLLAAYRDFSLDASFTAKGTVEFAFAYNGILGPNRNSADSVPSARTLSDYCAVRICENKCSVLSVCADGSETVYAEAVLDERISRLQMRWQGDLLSVQVNETALCSGCAIAQAAGVTAPLALIVREFSRIDCSKFEVSGETEGYSITYNAEDALLGAGQWMPDAEPVDPEGALERDKWHHIPGGYVGEGLVCAKWNVIGSRFTLKLQKSPAYGSLGVWIDGIFNGSVDLCGEGEAEFSTEQLKMGLHAVRVAPLRGRIAISGLIAAGITEP